jgi:NhaP-type Na+/H+ or K+/H+ antiporter
MLLLAESAVNDGMAYPFLTLSFALTLGGVAGKPTSEVVLQWLLVGVLCMQIRPRRLS